MYQDQDVSTLNSSVTQQLEIFAKPTLVTLQQESAKSQTFIAMLLILVSHQLVIQLKDVFTLTNVFLELQMLLLLFAQQDLVTMQLQLVPHQVLLALLLLLNVQSDNVIVH